MHHRFAGCDSCGSHQTMSSLGVWPELLHKTQSSLAHFHWSGKTREDKFSVWKVLTDWHNGAWLLNIQLPELKSSYTLMHAHAHAHTHTQCQKHSPCIWQKGAELVPMSSSCWFQLALAVLKCVENTRRSCKVVEMCGLEPQTVAVFFLLIQEVIDSPLLTVLCKPSCHVFVDPQEVLNAKHSTLCACVQSERFNLTGN